MWRCVWGGANFNGWEGLAPQAALVLAPGISKHSAGRVYAHNEHATFVQLSSATKWNVSNKTMCRPVTTTKHCAIDTRRANVFQVSRLLGKNVISDHL